MKLLTYLTTFIVIIIAELGDKTQVATLLFASNNPKKKWQVLFAAALALSLCVTIEVTVGITLTKYISPNLINKVAGIVFLLIGIFTGITIIKNMLILRIPKPTPEILTKNDPIKF